MDRRDETILCAICLQANPEIEALNHRINQHRTVKEKAPFARQLIARVEDILREHNTAENPLTQTCERILNLRKQAAELILKAESLFK